MRWWWIGLVSCAAACQSAPDGAPEVEAEAREAGCGEGDTTYRSDYFVFVSADADAPRVVPVDLNWEPAPGGTLLEYKAWDGREEPAVWPIRYVRDERQGVEPPCRWEQLPLGPHFAWSSGPGTLSADVEGARVSLAIPEFSPSSSFVSQKPSGATSTYSVARTTLDGDTPGWLIHERVRLPEIVKASGSRPLFGRFHWFALGDAETGRFYLFVDDTAPDGATTSHEAVRWTPGEQGEWRVESTSAFTLEETRAVPEGVSGRQDVPVAWRITSPAWGVDATLETGSGHTGHGERVGKGRALFRQALATGPGLHGMIELILMD